jgi:glutamine synthetase
LPSSKNTQRIEIRSPDPLCNPYIALTLIIYAAMEGIKNKIEPAEPIEENLFDEAVAKKYKLKSLPKSLNEAKKLALESEFVKSVPGAIIK